jgi:hypothetical protein
MSEAEFADRVSKIRARFISKLDDKINATAAALPQLCGDDAEAVNAVDIVYRRFHEICGIGPTIGFEATGRVAKTLDGILIGPFRDHRGLRSDELGKLKEGLASLRVAARNDTQGMGAA